MTPYSSGTYAGWLTPTKKARQVLESILLAFEVPSEKFVVLIRKQSKLHGEIVLSPFGFQQCRVSGGNGQAPVSCRAHVECFLHAGQRRKQRHPVFIQSIYSDECLVACSPKSYPRPTGRVSGNPSSGVGRLSRDGAARSCRGHGDTTNGACAQTW